MSRAEEGRDTIYTGTELHLQLSKRVVHNETIVNVCCTSKLMGRHPNNRPERGVIKGCGQQGINTSMGRTGSNRFVSSLLQRVDDDFAGQR